MAGHDLTALEAAAVNGGLSLDEVTQVLNLDPSSRATLQDHLLRAGRRDVVEAILRTVAAVLEHEQRRHIVISRAWADPATTAAVEGRAFTSLPEAFWDARNELSIIRQAAWASRVSPDALMGACLARLAFLVHPRVRLPAMVGEAGTLDLCVALVGRSGAGKGAAMGTARRVLQYPVTAEHVDKPLGSGEGIVEQYMGTVEVVEPNPEDPAKFTKRKVRQQTKFHGLFSLDEGQALSEMANRKGSTLWPTIRSAWSGSMLGQANAQADRDRVLQAGSYRFALVAAFQPEYAVAILDDLAGGTPQRFLWLSALDPNAPEVRMPWPGPLYDLDVDRADQITAVEQIWREVDQDRLRTLRGTSQREAVDSHRNLLRLKVAALLAILDDRRELTWEDWGLAGVLLDTSDAVRQTVYDVARAHQAELQAQEAQLAGVRALGVQNAVEVRATEAAARAIARHVHRGQCEDGCGRGCTWRAVAGKHRALVDQDEAVALAVARGWITPEFTPGASVPSEAPAGRPKDPT